MTCTIPLTTHHPPGPAHVRTIVLINTRKRSYEQEGKKAKVHELHTQVCKKAQREVMFTTFFWKSMRFQHLNFPFCKIILLYNLNYKMSWHPSWLSEGHYGGLIAQTSHYHCVHGKLKTYLVPLRQLWDSMYCTWELHSYLQQWENCEFSEEINPQEASAKYIILPITWILSQMLLDKPFLWEIT